MQFFRDSLRGSLLEKYLTHKFTVITKSDKHHNQFLEVNMELRKGRKSSRGLKARIYKFILDGLRKKNAEYKYLSDMMPGRVDPKIVLWPYEHPLHFQVGMKQKWAKKKSGD